MLASVQQIFAAEPEDGEERSRGERTQSCNAGVDSGELRVPRAERLAAEHDHRAPRQVPAPTSTSRLAFVSLLLDWSPG